MALQARMLCLCDGPTHLARQVEMPMVRVVFHPEALTPPARRRGLPFVPPMRWWEAPHSVLLLEGWDPQGEGHGCALDALRRIYNTVTDHPTTVQRRWEEVVCRVQARLPYVTAGALVALPLVSAQLATGVTLRVHRRARRSRGMQGNYCQGHSRTG